MEYDLPSELVSHFRVLNGYAFENATIYIAGNFFIISSNMKLLCKNISFLTLSTNQVLLNK